MIYSYILLCTLNMYMLFCYLATFSSVFQMTPFTISTSSLFTPCNPTEKEASLVELSYLGEWKHIVKLLKCRTYMYQ